MALRATLMLALLLAVLAAVAPPAMAAGTQEAVRRCQALLPGFETDIGGITISVDSSGLDRPTGIRIDWQALGDKPDGWILCWFLPRTSEEESWQIAYLETSKYGRLSRYDLQQLYKLLYLAQKPLQDFGAEADQPFATALYALQQTINGISLGCVYGLIAVGFTLIYGITRAINFAFGEIYMIGAFLMLIGNTVLIALGGAQGALALLLIAAAIVVTGGAYGWAMDRMVFRHLRKAPVTVSLIAAIGIAILLKDGARLLQGAKTRYLLVEDLDSWAVITGHGFDVYMTKGHVVVGLATLAITALLWWISMRTNFGRAQRACAQDPLAAALMGVNVERTISLTFVLGTAIVIAAGLFAGAQYGVINFHMGTLVGFKALTAALLGGIGSLPGAFLGGMLIALTEAYTAALIGAGWEDIAVFTVLVLVLLFRPAGILGRRDAAAALERP